MKDGHSTICQRLNAIKVEHKLTNQRWSELSGVPLGTVNRYLSYNAGVPNFPYVCAMLEAVGITPNDFYACISGAVASPAETMVMAPEAVEKAPLNPQQDATLLASMRERVAQQADRILELQEATHEQDAQLRELRAEKRAAENLIAERDRSISRRDAIIRTRGLLIVILGAILVIIVVLDLLFSSSGWLHFGPL